MKPNLFVLTNTYQMGYYHWRGPNCMKWDKPDTRIKLYKYFVSHMVFYPKTNLREMSESTELSGVSARTVLQLLDERDTVRKQTMKYFRGRNQRLLPKKVKNHVMFVAERHHCILSNVNNSHHCQEGRTQEQSSTSAMWIYVRQAIQTMYPFGISGTVLMNLYSVQTSRPCHSNVFKSAHFLFVLQCCNRVACFSLLRARGVLGQIISRSLPIHYGLVTDCVQL